MGASSTKNSISIINDVLQQNISNIIESSSSELGNYVSNIQDMKIHINGDIKCNALNVVQNISVNSKFISQITASTASDVKAYMQSEIQNSTSQLMNVVYGVFSSIGALHNDTNKTDIQSRLSQLVEQNITVSHLNKIINSTISVQKQDIYINGTLQADQCNFGQNITLVLYSTAIVNDMITTAQDDQVLTRIANDATQSLTKEEKGIDTIVSMLTGPLMLLIILGAIVAIIVAPLFFNRATDPKFLIVIGIFILIYLALAYKFQWVPFKPKIVPEYWKCSMDSAGHVNGGCTQTTADDKSALFSSQDDCKAKIATGNACLGYWGCAKDGSGLNNGTCIQYTSALNGPYTTQVLCEADIKAGKNCINYYGCDKVKKTCMEYPTTSDTATFTSMASCSATCK